jgi:hypothetical protein
VLHEKGTCGGQPGQAYPSAHEIKKTELQTATATWKGQQPQSSPPWPRHFPQKDSPAKRRGVHAEGLHMKQYDINNKSYNLKPEWIATMPPERDSNSTNRIPAS